MRRELTAWFVVGIAGVVSGAFAGVQPRLTAASLLVVSGIVAVASGVAASILRRGADRVP